VLLAVTRLPPHLTSDFDNCTEVQGEAMRTLMEEAASKRRAPSAHSQEQLDQAATAALEQAAEAAGGVAEGHDDPEGEARSVEDFGVAQLPTDSGTELPTAISAVPHFPLEQLGFRPPADSGPLDITYQTPDHAAQPQ
jgi:hypothetical protein